MDPNPNGGEFHISHEMRENDNGVCYVYVTIERVLSRDTYCVDGFSKNSTIILPSCVRTYMGDGSGQTWSHARRNMDEIKEHLPQDVIDEIERQIPLMAIMLS